MHFKLVPSDHIHSIRHSDMLFSMLFSKSLFSEQNKNEIAALANMYRETKIIYDTFSFAIFTIRLHVKMICVILKKLSALSTL